MPLVKVGNGSGSGDVTVSSSLVDQAIVIGGGGPKKLASSVVFINASGNVTGVTGLTVSGTAGVDITPSSDANADLITLNVTGTPTLAWNESSDVFTLSKGLAITGTASVTTNLSVGSAASSDGKIRLLNSSSSAEYDIYNYDDTNIPYDSLWLQRVYSQSYITNGDPYATLVVVRAPENSAVISSVDTGTDVVTTSAAHNFATGDGVIVQNSGGGVPGGLTASTFYAVRALSTTTLAFFPTVADANANTNRINLTSAGTGTNTIYLASQEATTTYQRVSGTRNEFMDVYANGYEDSTQFGIRVQKRGTGAALRPFVVDNYDGSTYNTLIYVDNVNNRIGLGGNVAPSVALDLTGEFHATGPIVTTATEFGIDSASTAVNYVDRGANTSFGLQVFRTAGTDEWSLGLRNGGNENFFITDAVNGVHVIQAVQGATPIVTASGIWNHANRLSQIQGADVASANNLTLGLDGNTFEITGTTQINAITIANWQNGSEVKLLFTSNPTVKHNTAGAGGTAVILLAGAADFVASSGDVLTLVLSEIGGTQAWRETGRTVI